MRYRLIVGAAVAVVAAMSLACGGNTTTKPTQSGTLSVLLKDSPFSDAKSLLVTFTEVSAHLSGGDWTKLALTGGATSRTCDLKRLVASTDVLGTGPLSAGHYTEIRLTVSSAALYFDNATVGPACSPTIAVPAGKTAPVSISSGTIKLNQSFEVPAGGTTTMLLDFDGDRSVVQQGNGNYSMSPVISVVSVQ